MSGLNYRIQQLRDLLLRSNDDLLTVADLATGIGLTNFEVTTLLKFIRPAWKHSSEFYDRKELLRALGSEERIDDDPESFAPDAPSAPPGCKLVLEGAKRG